MSSAVDLRKMKGLKKARSRGRRAREDFYRETIPQERTS